MHGSPLDRLVMALERDRAERRTRSLDGLQVKMLASYQPFNPAQDNIRSWVAGFKRLVPEDASDNQVLKALICRLPPRYADLLEQARRETDARNLGWKQAVSLFLYRVAGGENRLTKLRRLKTLQQKDGEPIREFAIRVRDELQRVRGRPPSDQEWRDEVMVGALDATALELERVASQAPDSPSFWDIIRAVEFWERQHAALLNQGDPSAAIHRSPHKGASVLLGNPRGVSREPDVTCTWCSQRGHLESTCFREPRCARCFGPHPERNHDAVVGARRAELADRMIVSSRSDRRPEADQKHFDSRQGRGARPARGRDHTQDNVPGDSPRPPPPPQRAIAKAAQDAAERGRSGDRRPDGTQQRRTPDKRKVRCYACGEAGHTRRECPETADRKGSKDEPKVQANLAITPHAPTPVPALRDGGSPSQGLGIVQMLHELEQHQASRIGRDQAVESGEEPKSGDYDKAIGTILASISSLAKRQAAAKSAASNPFD